MKKKDYLNRVSGLLLMLPLSLSLAGCDSSAPSGRDIYQEEDETPTPTKESQEKPTEADPTPAEDTEPETKIDYDKIYAPILTEYLETIRDGYDMDKDYTYLSVGIMEKLNYENSVDLLKNVGYMIADISGDGIPELLIGENAKYDLDDIGESAYIYDAYTCADEQPVTVFEGWGRNSVRWMGDGKFFNEGSSGAAHTSFGQFHLSADGTQMIWDDFYFTTDETGVYATYHNTSGVTDVAASEMIDPADLTLQDLMNSFKTKTLTFKAIGSYKVADASAQSGNGSQASGSDEPIVGVWSLRSYVNMKVMEYIVFDDGTWLAVETMPSYVTDGSFAKGADLCGTWKEGKGGSAGYYAYDLLDENGDVFEPVLVYEDADGYMVMNFTSDLLFYYSDMQVPDEVEGGWLTMRGSKIEFDDDYNWNYYDDEGNWMFGGHCVIESGPGYEYLRLHTQAGDTGNIVFAEGEYYMNNAGGNVIDITFAPEFRDLTGTEESLYKER